MDFLANLTKGSGDAKKNEPAAEEKSATTPDLMTSAREMGAAATTQVTSAPGKAAGAAADLLGAGSDYAKLDETKGFGKAVDQAEVYLRDYSTTAASGEAKPPAAPAETTEGGGVGDYAKKAQEFFTKPSEGSADAGEKKESEGLLKTAGGLFSK